MTYKTQVALGAMELIAEGSVAHELQALGVSYDDYLMLTGPMPWKGPDQARMKQALNTLLYGAMDIAALPHFELSAEYCAAMVGIFVDGRNTQKACSLMGRLPSNDMVTGVAGAQEIDPSQVFGLVLELKAQAPDYSEFRLRFEKQVGFKIKKAELELAKNA